MKAHSTESCKTVVDCIKTSENIYDSLRESPNYNMDTSTHLVVLNDLLSQSLIYALSHSSIRESNSASLNIAKQFMFLSFLGGKFKNYAKQTASEQVCIYCDYSPQHAYLLLHNRFINASNKTDKCQSNDEYLEGRVKLLKQSLQSHWGKVTFEHAVTVNQILGFIDVIEPAMMKYLDIAPPLNKNTKKDLDTDINDISEYIINRELLNPYGVRSAFESIAVKGFEKFTSTTYIQKMLDTISPIPYPEFNSNTQSLFEPIEVNINIDGNVDDLPSSSNGNTYSQSSNELSQNSAKSLISNSNCSNKSEEDDDLNDTNDIRFGDDHRICDSDDDNEDNDMD